MTPLAESGSKSDSVKNRGADHIAVLARAMKQIAKY